MVKPNMSKLFSLVFFISLMHYEEFFFVLFPYLFIIILLFIFFNFDRIINLFIVSFKKKKKLSVYLIEFFFSFD